MYLTIFLQPFWPTGSGCARGFLGGLDAAWMIRSWASGKMTPLQVIAERESVYQLLSQTTPENLNKNFNEYTIDPNTRYLLLHFCTNGYLFCFGLSLNSRIWGDCVTFLICVSPFCILKSFLQEIMQDKISGYSMICYV